MNHDIKVQLRDEPPRPTLQFCKEMCQIWKYRARRAHLLVVKIQKEAFFRILNRLPTHLGEDPLYKKYVPSMKRA